MALVFFSVFGHTYWGNYCLEVCFKSMLNGEPDGSFMARRWLGILSWEYICGVKLDKTTKRKQIHIVMGRFPDFGGTPKNLGKL